MRRFFVRDGKRVISRLTNEDVVLGNFKVVDTNEANDIVQAGQGKPTVIGLCKECAPAIGGESYTHEAAVAARDQAANERASFHSKVDRAAAIRKSLLRPDGSPRIQGGASAAEDMAATANLLANRRGKRDFRGGRDRR